jgi:hypothetical protein
MRHSKAARRALVAAGIALVVALWVGTAVARPEPPAINRGDNDYPYHIVWTAKVPYGHSMVIAAIVGGVEYFRRRRRA